MHNYYLLSIISSAINNKYTRWYAEIISRSLCRTLDKDIYTEKHHILPKCFKQGGESDKNNIAKLTAKEHFICHRLLVEMFSDGHIRSKLAYALWQMSYAKDRPRYRLGPIAYQKLKIKLSNETKNIEKTPAHKANMRKPKSKFTPGPNTFKKGMAARNKGVSMADEQKKKLSEAMKGRYVGDQNPFHGKQHTPETRQKIREANLGTKHSDAHREKISQSLKGKPTWNAGIPAQEVTKEKISIALKGHAGWNKGLRFTDEQKKKVSDALKGRIYINNGEINRCIKSESLADYDISVWKIGKIKKPRECPEVSQTE